MATTVNVKNVKAADPGLGFELDLDSQGSPINNTLKVVVMITDVSGNASFSTLSVNNPITDLKVAFVIPFGDSKYASTTSALTFNLEVYIPNNASAPVQSIQGCVFPDPGAFVYSSNLPTSVDNLGSGQMMNSIDGRYIGIMQTDGNFCVYKKYALGQNNVPNTDSSYSAGYSNSTLTLKNGRIYIVSNNGTNVSASPSSQAMPGASVAINEQGFICLQLPGQKPVQVQVRPANLP